MTKLNGNTWRLITPFLLIILTGTSSVGIWMMNDIKEDIDTMTEIAEENRLDIKNHLGDTNLHYYLSKDIDNLNERLECGIKVGEKIQQALIDKDVKRTRIV